MLAISGLKIYIIHDFEGAAAVKQHKCATTAHLACIAQLSAKMSTWQCAVCSVLFWMKGSEPLTANICAEFLC